MKFNDGGGMGSTHRTALPFQQRVIEKMQPRDRGLLVRMRFEDAAGVKRLRSFLEDVVIRSANGPARSPIA